MGKITVATSSGSKPVKSDGLASQGQKHVSRSSSITTFDSSCILPRHANKKTPTLHRMNGAFWTAVYAWMSMLWNLVHTPFGQPLSTADNHSYYSFCHIYFLYSLFLSPWVQNMLWFIQYIHVYTYALSTVYKTFVAGFTIFQLSMLALASYNIIPWILNQWKWKYTPNWTSKRVQSPVEGFVWYYWHDTAWSLSYAISGLVSTHASLSCAIVSIYSCEICMHIPNYDTI